MSEPFFVCEVCRQRIDIDAPETVKAHKLIRTDALDGAEYIEGEGLLFHASCYRPNPSWRRAH